MSAVLRRTSHRPLVGLVLVGVSTLLSACGGGDDGDRGTGGLDVLDLVPAGVTSLDFRDRQAWAERLGIPEDADAQTYVDTFVDAEDIGGGATSMTTYVSQMAEGSAFDDRDVVWELSGRLADDSSFTVLRVDDTVDLDEVVDDLVEAGLTEDELRGRRHVSGDPVTDTDPYNFIGGTYPYQFIDTTVDVDEHLVLLGYGSEEVLATIDGDRDSVADAGTFDALLDGADADEAEVVSLFTDAVCAATAPDDERASERLTEQYGDLGRPRTLASLQTGADELAVSTRLEFGDEDLAQRDLEARRTFLAEGISPATGEPFTDSFTAELDRRGSVVVVDVAGERPRTALQVGTGPLTCGPEA